MQDIIRTIFSSFPWIMLKDHLAYKLSRVNTSPLASLHKYLGSVSSSLTFVLTKRSSLVQKRLAAQMNKYINKKRTTCSLLRTYSICNFTLKAIRKWNLFIYLQWTNRLSLEKVWNWYLWMYFSPIHLHSLGFNTVMQFCDIIWISAITVPFRSTTQERIMRAQMSLPNRALVVHWLPQFCIHLVYKAIGRVRVCQDAGASAPLLDEVCQRD